MNESYKQRNTISFICHMDAEAHMDKEMVIYIQILITKYNVVQLQYMILGFVKGDESSSY